MVLLLISLMLLPSPPPISMSHMKEHEWNSAIHSHRPQNSQGIILSHLIYLKFYFPSLLIPTTIATMVQIKHETFQLKMIHLSQFIQVRYPMKNLKKMSKFNKTS